MCVCPNLAAGPLKTTAAAIFVHFVCRYQPYRVAGGVSKPAGGGVGGPAGGRRNKWSHDLFDPNQQAPPPAAADEAAADGAAAVGEEEEAAAVEMME